MYLNTLPCAQHIDILCLQYTWLLDRHIDQFNSMHPANHTFGKSGVDAAKQSLPGRTPGVVAIAWRQSLSHNIRVIDINKIRICAVRFELNAANYMLTVYEYMYTYSALTVLRYY